MNQTPYRGGHVPSLLDRLIEEDDRRVGQARAGGDLLARGQSLSELEESVRRDLQDLLNTRQVAQERFPEDSELACSLLTYGLPELEMLNPSFPDQRQLLQDIVERTIQTFEPRLAHVRVTSIAADSSAGRGLRMSVEALLRVDPAPVPVIFDTVIEPTTGNWHVVKPGGS